MAYDHLQFPPTETKTCINCEITIYYDEMEPIYCDQCGKILCLK